MKHTDELRRIYGTGGIMLAILDDIRGDVLDFGAGTGKQRKLISGRAKSYTALDIEPHPSVDIVGDVLDPPVADASYDTIISNQVIEHVRKPWVMVQQMARILRPGGKAIITAPFLVPYHAHPHDYFRFTEAGLTSLCEDAGLKVLLCTKYGGIGVSLGEMTKFRFFSPYDTKRSRLNRLVGRYVESCFRLLNRLLPPGICYGSVLCIAQKP